MQDIDVGMVYICEILEIMDGTNSLENLITEMYNKDDDNVNVKNQVANVLIRQLCTETSFLREEIMFLWKDGIKKTNIIEKLTEKIASLEISKSLLNDEKVSAENVFESTLNKPVNKQHVTIHRKKHLYVMDENETDDDNLITTYSTLITDFQHTCNENSVEENESEDKSVYINFRKDTSLKNQIKEIRNAKHKIYVEKNKENKNDDIANNNNNKWPKNTILITGDSILNNIQES